MRTPIHTATNVILRTPHDPILGDRHDIEASGMYPFTAVVMDRNGALVRVGQVPTGEDATPTFGVWMPAASVGSFVNDLRGHVYGETMGVAPIDAVLRGEATWLGKGDDGLVFQVGDQVVKVSTTVPYQPFNPGHRTPEEAIERLQGQWQASEEMRRAGVPGILPSTFVRHDDKGYLIKPYVEIMPAWSSRQLAELAEAVEAAHARGWVFGDAIQPGVYQGKVYHYDTGKAHRSKTPPRGPEEAWPWGSEEADDIDALKRFFKEHGARYLTAAEKIDPTSGWADLAYADPTKMTKEQRKAQRQALLRQHTLIQSFLKNNPTHPTARDSFWSDPAYAKEELADAMKRFAASKDPGLKAGA